MKSRAPTVLIVDDDEHVRLLARELCEADGFRVVGEAGDGKEAIAAAATFQPDVVVLDYMMPRMSGALAAGTLRAVAPAVRILAFSAVVDRAPEWSDAFLAKTHVSDLGDSLHRLLAATPAS